MPLRNTDAILVDPEAIAYIERAEEAERLILSKFEVIEYFFEWLKRQPRGQQIEFIREALSE